MSEKSELTVFQGRAGDRNELARDGAAAIGAAISERFGLPAVSVGTPEPPLGKSWRSELTAATPGLRALSARYDALFRAGRVPAAALPRCACALATLPVVARHRPTACVVWLDAHADMNTPESSPSGYLGGMVLSAAAGLWASGLGDSLDLDRTILVGLRDADPQERALIEERTIRVVSPQEAGGSALHDAVGGRPVYVHLDCDVLAPGIVPSEYQVKNGLSLADLNAVCRSLAESEVVGLEIAEFQNAWSTDGDPVSPNGLLDAIEPILARLPRG